MTRARFIAVLMLVGICGPLSAQEPRVLLLSERSSVNAVSGLGCKIGIGRGSGNAAKINVWLATRPGQALFIPGGHFEIDDTIIVPAKNGVGAIVGNGKGTHLNDNAYTGSTLGGNPTRLVWTGPAGGTMIQWNARYGTIAGMTLQPRLMPRIPTAPKARIGIHVKPYDPPANPIPTGKLKLCDVTFDEIPCGVLFGRDLDTAISSVQNDNNADESTWNNVSFYWPYNAGYGTGALSTRNSGTAGVVRAGDSSHGITPGEIVKVSWSGGSRSGAVVREVTGASITVGGGSGDNLPVQSTAVEIWAERTCMRFRTHQAVHFHGGHVHVAGHCHEIFFFERGSKMVQEWLSVTGWAGAHAAGTPCRALRIFKSYPGYFKLGIDLDATSTFVQPLWMDDFQTARTKVDIHGVMSDPAGGSVGVPLIQATGASQVYLRNFGVLVADSVRLIGHPGSGSSGSGAGLRQKVVSFHAENVSTAAPPADWLDDSSTGPYHLSWTHATQTFTGTADASGFEGQPYEDGELLEGGTRGVPALTKLKPIP